jgi:hypothetical protein
MSWAGDRDRAAWPPGPGPAGHLDEARTGAELWGAPPRSPRVGPVLAVDTSGPVDVPEVAATLTRLLGAEPGGT